LFIRPRYLTAESLNSTATKQQEAVRCITFGTKSRWAKPATYRNKKLHFK